ncbi:hypothetical protein LHJ74_30905 [Streptomyces sp. N2-109]|uniref:Uncharacterized protein n=1 Tax=Streptomyces gossypii TaxID=2883101 RepID=A0ABT2K276_9ACTN|nr:hypothetical protein [Streptomyces gossypii]MCT2594267.1 hypothetical protein [Streptomyces gossypii]
MKVYQRTENGTVTEVSVREALAEVNTAMMEGKRYVREMFSGRGQHSIEYKDGRSVRLVEVYAPREESEPREWHGTHSTFHHLHRMDETNRARCNRRIRANLVPPSGGRGPWGVFKRTRSEIENGESARLYTFCPKCATK